MTRTTLLFLLSAALAALLSGCLSAKGPSAVPESETAPRSVYPAWYTHPPRDDAKRCYALGEGHDAVSAKRAALAELRGKISARVREREKKRPIAGVESRRIDEVLEGLKIPAKEVASATLATGRYAVLLAVDRGECAKPLKRRVLARLVSVEERWQKAASRHLLERYRLANESARKIEALLPLYLVADAIEPFSPSVRKRAEESAPFFARMADRLKRRLRFCVEYGEVPAMRLFAKATQKALQAKRLSVENPRAADNETLCVSVAGELVRKEKEGLYEVDGTVRLLLHRRYGEPLAKQVYRVRGVSRQSGAEALENAAEALEKRLEKEFLLNV